MVSVVPMVPRSILVSMLLLVSPQLYLHRSVEIVNITPFAPEWTVDSSFTSGTHQFSTFDPPDSLTPR